MDKCEYCGEGMDPVPETETATEWQCNDCEQWNDKEPEPVEVSEANVLHMQRWAEARGMTPRDARGMTPRELMLSIEFLNEIRRLLDEQKEHNQ